jgi:hypothetical protein
MAAAGQRTRARQSREASRATIVAAATELVRRRWRSTGVQTLTEIWAAVIRRA